MLIADVFIPLNFFATHDHIDFSWTS